MKEHNSLRKHPSSKAIYNKANSFFFVVHIASQNTTPNKEDHPSNYIPIQTFQSCPSIVHKLRRVIDVVSR